MAANAITDKERDELKNQLREELLTELIAKNKEILAKSKEGKPRKGKAMKELRGYIESELNYIHPYPRIKLLQSIYAIIRYLMNQEYLIQLTDSEGAIEIAKDLIAVIRKYDVDDEENLE